MGTAINPLCASCRRAKALGYARRSPPARVITDSFFKVHQPSAIQGKARLRGRESCALLQERERHHLRCARLRRAPRQRRSSPAGASTRSGRALARTNGVTPDDGQCRMSSLTDQHARRSPRGERDGDGGRPRRFNLFENCYNPVCALRLRAGGRERDACPPVWIASLHAGETPALPGGAGTRPVVARQEHARTTVGCPGMHPDHQDLI